MKNDTPDTTHQVDINENARGTDNEYIRSQMDMVSDEPLTETEYLALQEAENEFVYPEVEAPEPELPYDGFEGNWPGDGSGMDDLADFNANEADDYYGDECNFNADGDYCGDE